MQLAMFGVASRGRCGCMPWNAPRVRGRRMHGLFSGIKGELRTFVRATEHAKPHMMDKHCSMIRFDFLLGRFCENVWGL